MIKRAWKKDKKQERERKTLDKFDTIEYTPLRIWNRSVMFFNIMEDSGEDAAKAYIRQFSKPEIQEMIDMYLLVKKHGAENIKRTIIREMPLPEHDHVHPENNVQRLQ